MRRPLFAVVATTALCFAWAPSAAAHANLESSEPAGGTNLPSPPRQVVLRFTEQPEIALSDLRVLDANGARVDRGMSPDEPRSLRVSVRELPRGSYTVAWRVVSKVDGHATAGSFAFGVRVTPGTPNAAPASAAAASPLEVAGRWLFIAGLVAALGGALVSLVVLRKRAGAVHIYVFAGAVVAVAGVVLLGAAQASAAGVGIRDLLPTSVGRALVWRAAAVVVALVAATWMGAIALVFVVAACALAMLFEVAAGHAAAGGSFVWAQVGAQWVHFLAAGAWIGGLGALLLGVRRAPSGEKASTVRRFSTMAATGLFVVAFTGTFRAARQVEGFSELTSSSYGRVVLVKVVLLGALALLGARNRLVNVPAAPSDLTGLRRTSRIELSVGAVVLLAAALLTALSPPLPARSAERLVATGSDLGRSVRVRLEIAPGYAGANEFRARITDPKNDAVAATRVRLRFELAGSDIGASTLALERDGDVWVSEGTNLSIDGRYEVTVLVQQETTSAEVPLEIATRCRTRATPGSEPVIYNQQLGSASVQTYVDPGRSGPNEVHFTFFDEDGDELSIRDDPEITAWGPGREYLVLDTQRFGEGHFVARARLDDGRWRFEADVKRLELRSCFEETID